MKVTKRVEEIISRRVREKFEPQQEALRGLFADEEKAEKAAIERMNAEIAEFIEGPIAKKYAHIFPDFQYVSNQILSHCPSVKYSLIKSAESRRRAGEKLTRKARRAEEDIILALEMGGNFDALEEMLDKVDTSFDAEE